MPGNNSQEGERERLSSLKKMLQIRQEALDIRDRLMGSQIEVITRAEKDLERLLERFYAENKDLMPPQQYEAAKKDFGYFLTLVEMAVAYYAT
jgi:hypothetical protein